MPRPQHATPTIRHASNRRSARSARLLSLAAAVLLALPAAAEYRSNMSGVVTGVMVYADTDQIYFTLSNQPTSHPACNPRLFSIDAATPPDRRKMMLARLLLAQASKEPMNVGFDDIGSCSHGYIRVHLVG